MRLALLLAVCCGALAALLRLRILRYVALGNSLASGAGSLIFAGYVPRFALWLWWRLKRVVLTRNLGRLGMTSAELLAELRTNERFRQAVRTAHLITVDIGGNDLIGCRYERPCMDEAVERFRQNWVALLREIRSLNSRADLLTMTLYNPVPPQHSRHPDALFYVRWVNTIFLDDDLRQGFGIGGVAPVFEAFKGKECEYTWFCLVGDIHPTDLGYQAITAALKRTYSHRRP